MAACLISAFHKHMKDPCLHVAVSFGKHTWEKSRFEEGHLFRSWISYLFIMNPPPQKQQQGRPIHQVYWGRHLRQQIRQGHPALSTTAPPSTPEFKRGWRRKRWNGGECWATTLGSERSRGWHITELGGSFQDPSSGIKRAWAGSARQLIQNSQVVSHQALTSLTGHLLSFSNLK